MIFDGDAILPEYLSDINALWCPSWVGDNDPVDRYDGRGNQNGRVEPCEIVKEPYDYTGWLIVDDVNILGYDKIGFDGTGPGGRWEEIEYEDTPWGELAAENSLGFEPGAASDHDFPKHIQHRGVLADRYTRLSCLCRRLYLRHK